MRKKTTGIYDDKLMEKLENYQSTDRISIIKMAKEKQRSDNKSCIYRMPLDVLEFLATFKNMTAVIVVLIRNTRAFKVWKSKKYGTLKTKKGGEK
jgi:hypothetical protein